ncbi:MAG: hypothetical protein PUP92_07850 [Rhizonema sp. PD38]|nr:hypothetical protein [Rhizonema sp. PD38]
MLKERGDTLRLLLAEKPQRTGSSQERCFGRLEPLFETLRERGSGFTESLCTIFCNLATIKAVPLALLKKRRAHAGKS